MDGRTTLLIALALVLGRPALTWGCITVTSPGTSVQIADEEAVIVWDAAHHTEHFIRGATFQTKAQNFGFLVPTPTPPALAQADAAAFTRLEQLTKPQVRHETRTGVLWTTWLSRGSGPNAATVTAGLGDPGSVPPVRVLTRQRVGGYEAVVLKADDTGALTRWLSSHGYEARPAVRAWLAPYVARHWAVTAFKIAKTDPADSEARSSVVRMSFATPRPFFPYHEPADQRKPGADYPPRLLRVFLLGREAMDGALGGKGESVNWPGRQKWSDRLTDQERAGLAAQLGLSDRILTASSWLTTFEDRSSPRPGTDDVFFGASSRHGTLRPVSTIVDDRRIPIPLDVITVVIGAILVGARVRARARQEAV